VSSCEESDFCNTKIPISLTTALTQNFALLF
jgi:hypothetical protein